jgi:hypothetical protein
MPHSHGYYVLPWTPIDQRRKETENQKSVSQWIEELKELEKAVKAKQAKKIAASKKNLPPEHRPVNLNKELALRILRLQGE